MSSSVTSTARHDPVRLGVAGLGAVAQAVHLPLIARLPDRFRVDAVCDLSASIRRSVGARYRVDEGRRHPTVESMLDAGSLDAIVILTSGSHVGAATQAMEAEVAVLCEKPLGYTLGEVDGLAAVQARTSGRILLGYMKLYDPAVAEARRLLDERQSLGELRSAEVTVLHPTPEAQLGFAHLLPAPDDVAAEALAASRQAADMARRVALGQDAAAQLGPLYTDILLGSIVHELAVLRALCGDPAAIDRVDVWPDGAWPPSVGITGRLEQGARVAIGWHYLPWQPAYREEVRLHFERGSMELVFPAPYRLHMPTSLVVRTGGNETVDERRYESIAEAFEQQLFAFEALVRDGTQPRAGIDEGRTDIVTCQRIAARRAADLGIRIGGEAASTVHMT